MESELWGQNEMKEHAHYETIECVTCDSAREFLDEVRINSFRWGSGIGSPWMFRGHADARWRLQPKAWRSDGRSVLAPLRLRFENDISVTVGRSNAHFGPHTFGAVADACAQLEAVDDFVDLCDSLGMYLPGNDTQRREYFQKNLHNFDTLRKPYLVDECFGFAQHHGVPTALLDCTKDPLTAAYFASCEDRKDVSEIAVWGINLAIIHSGYKTGIEGVKIKHHNFSYLHAQDAVFLHYTEGLDAYAEEGEWPCIEDVVESKFSADPANRKRLVKVILPVEHLVDLRKLLFNEKRSLAHLQPTYDNVCKTLIKMWSWT